MNEIVKSPCVNICELGEDNFCLGCYRSLGEIGDWRFANNHQRRLIVTNAKQRKAGETSTK